MARRKRKGRRGNVQASIGVISVSRKGYAFVDTSEGQFFVLQSHQKGAMDGDMVEVVRLRSLEARRQQQMRGRGEQEVSRNAGETKRGMLGGVRRVLQRAHTTLVGTLHYEGGLGAVTPHDERIHHDIFLDPSAARAMKAKDGDIVLVRITNYPGKLESAAGYIEEVVGREGDRSLGIEVIIREHGFETVFSAGALKEAERLVELDFDSTKERLTRRDLRDRFVFTIDPADARDFDDALSIDFIDGQMRLGVHIADVSAYVPWDSAIDLDARRRATSVYLPDRVIPMLPLRLSEQLCSLRPGEDKATFSVDMLIDPNGSVISSEFYPSIIRSSRRLSYDEALEMLEAAPGTDDIEEPDLLVRDKLLALRKLSRKLTRRRLQRGAIEFDGVEAKVALDGEAVPICVDLRTKNDATTIVEEAMILANEQVAFFMLTLSFPMVYRIHDEPYPAALEELLPVLQEFGYATSGAPQTSREIQAILDAAFGRPEHYLISTLLLRAMKRARYAPFFSTHFGLASLSYTHFTAPIRRYPDLMAHRLLRYQLSGETPPASLLGQLDWICEHASDREREAEAASYEATALKLCEFLEPRIGQCFHGVVVSLNSSGFYVREDTTTAEGFVDRDTLPTGFVFEKGAFRYHDPDTGKTYRLGQPIRVELTGVDISRAKLNFVVA